MLCMAYRASVPREPNWRGGGVSVTMGHFWVVLWLAVRLPLEPPKNENTGEVCWFHKLPSFLPQV